MILKLYVKLKKWPKMKWPQTAQVCLISVTTFFPKLILLFEQKIEINIEQYRINPIVSKVSFILFFKKT